MKRLYRIPRMNFAVLLTLFAASLCGQTLSYTVTGTVTDESGTPLIGVTVRVEDTNSGAVTDFDGNYQLTGSAGAGEYLLFYSYIGYATERRTLNLATGPAQVNLDVELGPDALSLDEVIVTGASVATSRRQLGNAVSSLDNTALEETGAIAIDQALSGKIAGALVQQNSGDPAGGISVRLRGASTISGSSDPLYIIDGIIVNNSSSNLVDLGGTSQNRLVDINPADIDRIEVIKGAAAAAIYGSRASNGVVQIFTKRGKQGKPRINFSTSLRVNQLRKEIDYNTAPVAWEDPFDNDNLATVPVTRYNYQDDIFDTGLGTENNLSISGGNDKTRYFISGSYLNNEGIVTNTGFERFSGRMNLDQEISSWLNLSFGINYARSGSDDIPNGGINSAYGALTGFLFSDNQINSAPNSDGIYPVTSPLVPRSNPLEAVSRFDFGQRTNRTITNIGLTAVPLENLTIKYVLGVDYANSSATGFIPIGNTSTEPLGYSRRSDANTLQYNNDLTVSYNTDLTGTLTSTTVAGGTWQQESNERIAIQSSRIAPFINISSIGELTEPGESRFEVSYWGGFVQQTFG